MIIIIIATVIETEHEDSGLAGKQQGKNGDICGFISIEHYLLIVEAGFGKKYSWTHHVGQS